MEKPELIIIVGLWCGGVRVMSKVMKMEKIGFRGDFNGMVCAWYEGFETVNLFVSFQLLPLLHVVHMARSRSRIPTRIALRF